MSERISIIFWNIPPSRLLNQLVTYIVTISTYIQSFFAKLPKIEKWMD